MKRSNLHDLLLLMTVIGIISCNSIIAQNSDFLNTLLLKNYKPVSIFNVQVTNFTKARFKAIDAHTHSSYANNSNEIEKWIRDMDSAGISKTIVFTGTYGAKFDAIYKLYQPYLDRFDLWCGFDFRGSDKPGFGAEAVKELERCFKIGAKGVGELSDKGNGLTNSPPSSALHPNDPRMDPLFKKCSELGMPVNIHIAEPKWMYEKMDSTNDGLLNAAKWQVIMKAGTKNHEEMIEIFEKTLKRHPKTIFIACHLANCCYDLQKASRLMDNYPNLYMDISARFNVFSSTPRAAAAFFTKYQDRLFYGTDWNNSVKMYRITFRILESADEHFYERTIPPYHWPLYGLKLNDEVLSKIYFENASRILNIK